MLESIFLSSGGHDDNIQGQVMILYRAGYGWVKNNYLVHFRTVRFRTVKVARRDFAPLDCGH